MSFRKISYTVMTSSNPKNTVAAEMILRVCEVARSKRTYITCHYNKINKIRSQILSTCYCINSPPETNFNEISVIQHQES
jgi:hypothetical protein